MIAPPSLVGSATNSFLKIVFTQSYVWRQRVGRASFVTNICCNLWGKECEGLKNTLSCKQWWTVMFRELHCAWSFHHYS